MFRKAANELILEFSIRPAGPLLIKSSQESASNPLLPSMNFVRSTHPALLTDTIYIPGSSLKGVIRSRAEQIARTLDVRVDDFNDNLVHSGHQDMLENPNVNAYQIVCSITRLFGSTNLGSRLQITDFYPTEAIKTLPIRQMVAIDRRSGASANTFTMEVALPYLPVTEQEVVFVGSMRLSNFERWHLGLLALVLRDMITGLVTVGYGSSRGLGQIALSLDELFVIYPGISDRHETLRRSIEHHLAGVEELFNDDDRTRYGVQQRNPPADSDFVVAPEITYDWGRAEIRLAGRESIESALRNTVRDWGHYVEDMR